MFFSNICFSKIATLCCSITLLAAFSLPAHFALATEAGNSNPATLQQLYACKNLDDEAARLACYDQAVVSLKAKEDNQQIFVVDKNQVEKVQKESFGFNFPSLSSFGKLIPSGNEQNVKNKKIKSDTGAKTVTLTLERTSKFGHDKTRFYFTNGQVWDQVTSEKLRIPKSSKTGGPVTSVIRKAALGSYLMRINNTGRSIRVRRRE